MPWRALGLVLLSSTAIVFVSAACSKPTESKPTPASTSSSSTTANAASRWIWIDAPSGIHLAFMYTDTMAGDSAKGSVVSDPPTADELASVVGAPTNTFRDPLGMGARGVTQAEREAMKLPDRPKWLDLFEPAGTTLAPRVAPSKMGRPASATPDAGSAGPTRVLLQSACGRGAGGFWMIEAGESFELGSALVKPGVKGGRLEGAGILPKHFVLKNDASGVELTPEPNAKVTVNDAVVTKATKLKIDDRIGLGESTLILRSMAWNKIATGPDPSCPGMKEALSIVDACGINGGGWTEIIGGKELTIGTDSPERWGMPKGFGSASPVRAKVKNENRTITFESLDPKKLPIVRGMPTPKGALSVGDSITLGDRVFYVTDEKQTGLPKEMPLPSCPEFEEKKKQRK